MKKILVINPGSTSTKIAFYHDGEQVWKESIEHDAAEIKKYAVIYDQKDMRTKLVRDALAAHGEKVTELDGVVARGGLLPSYVNEETGAVTTISSGAYEVTPALIEALRERPINHHASNLGCAIAYDIAHSIIIYRCTQSYNRLKKNRSSVCNTLFKCNGSSHFKAHFT